MDAADQAKTRLPLSSSDAKGLAALKKLKLKLNFFVGALCHPSPDEDPVLMNAATLSKLVGALLIPIAADEESELQSHAFARCWPPDSRGESAKVFCCNETETVDLQDRDRLCGFSDGVSTVRECCRTGWALLDILDVTQPPKVVFPRFLSNATSDGWSSRHHPARSREQLLWEQSPQ